MTASSHSEPRLLFISGSSREKSWNKKLAKLGENIADANGIKATFADLGDYPMQIYNGDIEANDGPPDKLRPTKSPTAPKQKPNTTKSTKRSAAKRKAGR